MLAIIIIIIIAAFILTSASCASCRSCFGMPSDNNSNKNRDPGYSYQQPEQTYQKKDKITPENPFDKNCFTDQCGWADNAAKTGQDLRSFYDKTGIQPYVLFKAYDPEIVSEKERHAWADDYFAKTLGDNQTAVLLVYFCEKDEEDDGWCELIIGGTAGSIIDADATDIFWEIFDSEWYSDAPTDDVIRNIFNNFAKRVVR